MLGVCATDPDRAVQDVRLLLTRIRPSAELRLPLIEPTWRDRRVGGRVGGRWRGYSTWQGEGGVRIGSVGRETFSSPELVGAVTPCEGGEREHFVRWYWALRPIRLGPARFR